MGITLQYISQRLSLLKKRLCLLRLRLCLLRMRVVLLVRCLVERLLLISDWIVKRILLISKSMLLLVAYLKTRKNSVSILACQASAFCVLLTLLSTTALSSIPSTNTKNVVLEASLDCTCDATPLHSKRFNALKQVEFIDNKRLNIHNLSYRGFLDTTPQKYVTCDSQISNREINVDIAHLKISTPLIQCDKMDPSLLDKVTTTSRDVKNQTLDISTNKGPKAREVLHIIFDHLNRFYYIGTRAIERDPSRMELKDPMGYHEPTVLRVGSIQKSVCLPGIPKTKVIKLGNTGLEIVNFLIPKSSPIKPLMNSLVKSTTIGIFKTTTITRKGRGLPSAIVFWKTLAAQHQHTLMKEQVADIFRYMHPRQVLIIMHHLRHPDQPLLNLPRQLSVRQIYSIAVMVRATFVPPFIVGDIPPFINTDGRVLVPHDQIKSVSKGVLFECKVLGPIFVLLRQENVLTKYISKHFEISLRRTGSNTMITDMIEFQINASKIGFEALNTVASRTPVIKRVSPVIKFVTSCVQEFFPMEVYIQKGKQHSDTINFNDVQEHLRTTEMLAHNTEVAHAMGHNLATFVEPLNRRNLVTDLTEIHDRNFFRVTWMIRYDFDVFEKFARYTSSKNK